MGWEGLGEKPEKSTQKNLPVRWRGPSVEGVWVGPGFSAHPRTSSGVDLQGRVIGVAARQPGSEACPGLGAPPHLPPPQRLSKEALKLDTSVERSGGLFKIAGQAGPVLTE